MSYATTTSATDTIWRAVAAERRRLADELEQLTDQQWRAQSQCDAWTVEELAAHLIVPFEVSTPRFMWAMVRRKGNFDRAIIDLTARVHAANTRSETLAKLRENAESRWTPPGNGAEVPLAEIVVHGQDIRRVIGLDNTVPAATVDLALSGITNDATRSDYAHRVGVELPAGQ